MTTTTTTTTKASTTKATTKATATKTAQRPVATRAAPANATKQASAEFEAPNQYGYFPSAIEAARKKRATQTGFDKQVKMTKAEQKERFSSLCSKHPELQKCRDDYVSPLRVKPSTQSVINGSVVRSDGIILVPGNKDDLVTWALDPAMSGDTLGLLLPTLFIIIGAQLKQAAGVPEYVSGAVGVTTKLIATGLVALYWVPNFVN
ncbi:predicted protein [Ostreococcus lucimarinus CCE9901]|uniref:Uncharacterized protein n=1 Tax=Ostreococcus lucimarinus (strain CCE9901) TaxID=436017 RepID=A4RVB7_OSTLU|nr:predicted protein [Ostreococcus lucimarinus CCE9901]ABO95107.1 predicted protein [Ostreococcus lucimarinus CCE9901]|eukprot:XP_001416814.1 predicted protein [Ostreococcus lucimarinus CCE9901]